MDERTQQAMSQAVTYALNRVQTDADFAWHMMDTQCMRLLVRAEALATGQDEDVVMERRRQWKGREKPEAQLPAARRRIKQLERAMEDSGIAVPTPA